MTEQRRKRLVVILGPTATGKSRCGIALARRVGGEIISGDSMLVYRGMDIGTAKPSAEELALVPHHLVNILSPEASFSVVEFREQAARLISDILGRGHLPILVGGTGLYIRSLLEDYQFSSVGSDPGFRQQWEHFAATEGNQALHDKLAALDPAAAARLHPNDVRRVVRALETAMRGETVSQQRQGTPVYDAIVFGLTMDRALLYERINARVDAMIRAGLEEEVRHLLEAGVQPGCQSMKSLGYRQMAEYLSGQCDFATAVDNIKKGTRHFAKRQLTWYRQMPYVHWLTLDRSLNYEQCVSDMAALLAQRWEKS
ncbi:MAG: tRNA (adenosine(37)-N6)-dimethylallyltransferase MiaA [Succiniclasticum sp.]|jgi:tRNA dimethylallyltransferase